jgi:hypothetical protein
LENSRYLENRVLLVGDTESEIKSRAFGHHWQPSEP